MNKLNKHAQTEKTPDRCKRRDLPAYFKQCVLLVDAGCDTGASIIEAAIEEASSAADAVMSTPSLASAGVNEGARALPLPGHNRYHPAAGPRRGMTLPTAPSSVTSTHSSKHNLGPASHVAKGIEIMD